MRYVCYMEDSHSLLIESIRKHVTLPEEDCTTILNHAQKRRFKKGQFIVSEGSVKRKTHFILKGAVVAYFTDTNGTEHLIQFATEGWWISDIHNYTNGTPALLNVQAIEDVELYEFSYDDMQHLYTLVPALESYFLIITQKAFATFQERVLHNLSLDAESRYQNFIHKYPKLALRFSQKWIASYLGISAEFLSKIKKRLRSED